MLKHRNSFNRHKLYRTFPKNKDDVKFLDNLLKSGEDGVSNTRDARVISTRTRTVKYVARTMIVGSSSV